MYNSETKCKVWTLLNNDVSVLVNCWTLLNNECTTLQDDDGRGFGGLCVGVENVGMTQQPCGLVLTQMI